MIPKENLIEYLRTLRNGIGYLLAPISSEGTLKTYMLNAISENEPENASVIERTKKFINDFKSNIY